MSKAQFIESFDDSSRAQFIAAFKNLFEATRGEYVSLPLDDTDLENILTSQEEIAISVDDDIYADQDTTGGGYAIFLFKHMHSNNTDLIVVSCKLKSSKDTDFSPVYLQIYNRNSTLWETIASETSVAAGVEFSLEGSPTGTIGNYYDSNLWAACRLYQEDVQ